MTTEVMDPGVHSAQLSVDLVAECMLYAENELSTLYCAVNQLFGLEQAQLAMEDWFSELETMEWPQEPPVPNWRRPTLAAVSLLAARIGGHKRLWEFRTIKGCGNDPS